MKKIILISSLSFAVSLTSYSQNEANHWFFGVHAGMDFSGGSAVAVTVNTIYTPEGCSSISDTAGNLLFYTDGVTVWNKNNIVMPNGSGLLAGTSSTQAALIVPQPGSNTLYYIFTTDEIGGPNGLRYSIVDMSLQGGDGDVTTIKNILVQNTVTEKLTAVKKANGIDYWIAVHEWGTDAFYIYTLSATAFQPIPVVSNSGMVHNTDSIQNTYGQMKFSFCGDRIALAGGYLDTVEVFDFDNATGIVSNAITIPVNHHVYGIEFSDDGQLLYVSTYNPLGTLVQYDLSSGNAATIIASKIVLSYTTDTYGLQYAPDGKIYVCKSFSQFLGVVNNPSLAGTGCNYVDNGFDLDPNFNGSTSALGLPDFVQSFFRVEALCQPQGIIELNSNSKSIVYPNPFKNNFKIIFSKLNHPFDIIICDAVGKSIETFLIEENQKDFSFGESLSTGIYFVFIKNNSGQEVIKVLKTGN